MKLIIEPGDTVEFVCNRVLQGIQVEDTGKVIFVDGALYHVELPHGVVIVPRDTFRVLPPNRVVDDIADTAMILDAVLRRLSP